MAAMVIAYTQIAAADDFMATKAPAISFTGPAYNWNGFYVGGHFGVAWGSSDLDAGQSAALISTYFNQSTPSTKAEASSWRPSRL